MSFLHNKVFRKLVLLVILAFSVLTFIFINKILMINIFIILSSVVSIYFIFTETYPIYLLIFLSFVTSYAFYGFLYQFNLPPWVIMLAIMVVFSYLFTYMEQKIGILGNKRLIYLVLFSLVILEVFLALSYFLINPLNQSIVISIVCYLFVGFCYTILARHTDNSFRTYLLIAGVSILIIFLSSNWGLLI
ncbi:MAG: hypothetical protein WCO23_05370 [bacterium]